MATTTLSKYRVYASDYSSFQSLQSLSIPGEIQVVMAFARDYDENGTSTKGKFIPYWNKQKITPQVISDFRENSQSPITFFVSIGGRDQKYPFSVSSSEISTWVVNAMDSLTSIIHDYKLDGIDVYYEHINANPHATFVDAIGQVISQLKSTGVITATSITASAPLSDTYYLPLFRKHKNIFNKVVYQSHNESNPISTVQGLVNLFSNLPPNYPKDKLFAGHSIQPKDWSILPLPIFLAAIPQLLTKSLVSGISMWTVTSDDDPEKEI